MSQGFALLGLLLSVAIPAQAPPALETIQKIAEVQKKLPWFFTPFPEGIRDLPYAYEYTFRKRSLNSKGAEVFPSKSKTGHYKQARSMHFEQIPLKSGYGWTTRCIEQDDLACTTQEGWNVPPQKNPADFRKAQEKRRQERVALWNEFLRAFRFELSGPVRVRFTPTGKYKHGSVKDSELFEILQGELWFDPATYEITHLQFELIKDAGNLFAKYYKGTTYTIDLTKAIDNRYVPASWSLKINKRMLTKKGFEETEFKYFNYRKFETSSTITFEGPQ